MAYFGLTECLANVNMMIASSREATLHYLILL